MLIFFLSGWIELLSWFFLNIPFFLLLSIHSLIFSPFLSIFFFFSVSYSNKNFYVLMLYVWGQWLPKQLEWVWTGKLQRITHFSVSLLLLELVYQNQEFCIFLKYFTEFGTVDIYFLFSFCCFLFSWDVSFFKIKTKLITVQTDIFVHNSVFFSFSFSTHLFNSQIWILYISTLI